MSCMYTYTHMYHDKRVYMHVAYVISKWRMKGINPVKKGSNMQISKEEMKEIPNKQQRYIYIYIYMYKLYDMSIYLIMNT